MTEVWMGFAVLLAVIALIVYAAWRSEHGYQWRTTGRWMR